MGCKDSTFVATDATSRGLHWYPAPGAGQLNPAVNEQVASCYDEGMRCLGIGACPAAVVMFRGSVAQMVQDRGSDGAKSKKSLFHQLEQMEKEGHLHKSLVGWAAQIRELGNEGAHPGKFEPVTKETAHALANLTRQLIRVEYEIDAEIAAARSLVDASDDASTSNAPTGVSSRQGPPLDL